MIDSDNQNGKKDKYNTNLVFGMTLNLIPLCEDSCVFILVYLSYYMNVCVFDLAWLWYLWTRMLSSDQRDNDMVQYLLKKILEAVFLGFLGSCAHILTITVVKEVRHYDLASGSPAWVKCPTSVFKGVRYGYQKM